LFKFSQVRWRAMSSLSQTAFGTLGCAGTAEVLIVNAAARGEERFLCFENTDRSFPNRVVCRTRVEQPGENNLVWKIAWDVNA
jgi:hypothetical protein